MSSRRLLALIQALPHDSAFQRARREGDWSHDEYVQAAVVNELRLLRADQAAIHANHRMDIDMVKSPHQTKQDDELREKASKARDLIMTQLNRGKDG
jgi:hypothetical protein